MNTKRITGLHMRNMLQNALANLILYEQELNSLNVFPVADGDTGTNMRMTLASGLEAAQTQESLGHYLKELSNAMLFGAHGNSGVILSQLFKGIYQSLSRCGSVNPCEMRQAFIAAYKTAYAAVVQPAEGTILTVAREGIEHIRDQIDRDTSFEELFSMYIGEMRKSLSHTPDMLPQLKEAGVLDSGALGYIVLVEGMMKYLCGEKLTMPKHSDVQALAASSESTGADPNDSRFFNENSLFCNGYCVEFVLQLMNGRQYSDRFHLDRFISDLQDFGHSIVAVQEEKRVKVHVHTMKPAKVLALSQEFGEFVTCKIENMQLQQNRTQQEKHERAKGRRVRFATVAVADSSDMRQLYYDIGCTCVIQGDEHMAISVQDFVDAVNGVNADHVVILPNNCNLIPVAHQAQELISSCHVTVLDTHSVPQGYCALSMDFDSEPEPSVRLRHLKTGAQGVRTLSVAAATKEYHADCVDCRIGMQVALLDGNVLCAENNIEHALFEGLKRIDDIDEKETLVIFRGQGVSPQLEAPLLSLLNETFPQMDITILYGGSSLYSWNAALS